LAVAYRLPVGGGSLDRRYEGGGGFATKRKIRPSGLGTPCLPGV